MPVDPELRLLAIDIPAQPAALVKLSLLLAEEDVNLKALAALIESDMALAAAVLKAVNSSLYGLSGRVQSVQQAITYLGTREVAAVTFEMGLRAVFPAAPELKPIWDRAARRGMLMGRIGAELGIDPWAAHSAGLFEECGKAVLFRHARERYGPLLNSVVDEAELVQREQAEFGVSNDKLGAALCESWGLAGPAVASVRHHVTVQATRVLPPEVARPGICALSALAHALMTAPDTLEDVAKAMAPQTQLDETLVLRGARKVQEKLAAAAERD
jgi:HD-like signal output (HDOD) protein